MVKSRVSGMENPAGKKVRLQNMVLKLPLGLVSQLEMAALKAGLTQEQWIVVAAFEKLRRELFIKSKKPNLRKRSSYMSAQSTPDFFMKILRQRNRTKKT